MLSLACPIHVQPLLEFKTIAHTDVFAHACAPAPKLGEFTFELYVKLEKIGEITFELYVKLEKIASWCLPRWPRHVCFPLLYLSLCIVERFVGCTFAHAHTHTSACWRSKFVFRTDTPTHVGAQSLSSEQIRIPNRYTYARCRSKFVFRTDTHIEQVVDQSLSSHVGYTYAR